MTLQEILTDLQINNAKTEGYYTVEQIKAIFNSASVDVSGAKSGAVTLTYSGPLDGVWAWQVAETVGESSNGNIRTIGQTDVSKLYKSDELRAALRLATGSNATTQEILEGTYTNGIRNPDGLQDAMSERFILAGDGPVVSQTNKCE